MRVENLPTHFGSCSFDYAVSGKSAKLTLSGSARPAAGFLLRLPPSPNAEVRVEGKVIAGARGDFKLPPSAKELEILWP
jgi:hypothetical protein